MENQKTPLSPKRMKPLGPGNYLVHTDFLANSGLAQRRLIPPSCLTRTSRGSHEKITSLSYTRALAAVTSPGTQPPHSNSTACMLPVQQHAKRPATSTSSTQSWKRGSVRGQGVPENYWKRFKAKFFRSLSISSNKNSFKIGRNQIL